MFTIYGHGRNQNCEGVSRRELLRIGALGLGGLTLPGLLATRATAASGVELLRDKAVVMLNLQGGPTHIETFDPKMTAPAEFRAMFGEVQTRLPGVTFGSHFPRLAALADKIAIVRNFRHGNGSHGSAAALVASGGNPLKSSMGTLYGRVAGTTNPSTGIPNNVVITPPACGEQFKGLGAQTERVIGTGGLPSAYKAFDPSSGGDIINNMKLRMAEDRLDDRRNLLAKLDRIKREIDATGVVDSADRFRQQAFDVILGGVAEAFDLSKEDPKTVERYDTSALDVSADLYRKKNKNLRGQSPIALGKQMLLARRLVEAGCGYVTVCSAGWDMHGNAFGINDGMPLLGSAVDIAASAFIEDLQERGLLDRVLLIITGEFGRTPKINSKAGRDHWGNLCTLAMAGGGLRVGQVIGQSDRTASRPATEPIGVQHLLATVMHSLFNVGLIRIEQSLPTLLRVAIQAGHPIEQLM